MTNKNFLRLKRVNEERYFKNDKELFKFVLRMRKQNIDQFYSSCEKINSIVNETLIPLDSKSTHRFIVIGRFICLLSEGCFVRTSGDYKYNLLTIQNTGSLTGNDMKKLFKSN